MSSDDLEKFRNEWKNELKGKDLESIAPCVNNSFNTNRCSTSHLADNSSDIFRNDSHSTNQSHLGCSECKQHPAFRENSKCHTCLFINRENKEEKTNTKFYPFRIVDDLLNTDKNGSVRKSELSTPKEPLQTGFKRKADSPEGHHSFDFFSKKQAYKKGPSERYLDMFIADLDEINEIPFFDLTVPREVAIKIFEPLDIQGLCRCSQVSKSWKSLADDELLWCRICHELGYERDTHAVEKTKWKDIVRYHVEQERSLIYNWKNRLGRFSQLQHVPGGILCAVNSTDDIIVSGYTNGDVKLWNVNEDYDCIFKPSNTSLIINDLTEGGTISNNVTHIAVSSDFAVAAYRQGNVDIWKTEGKDSTLPCHVIDCHDRRGLKSVDISQSSDLALCVSGPWDIGFVHICSGFGNENIKKKVINVPQHIVTAMIIEEGKANRKPYILVATDFQVSIHQTVGNDDDMFNHVTNIHHLIGSPVTCVDARSSPLQLAVGLGSYGGTIDPYRVKVYDLISGKLLSTLYNHTWTITCINVANSPENLLVTGSGDRRVRAFDIRTESMTHMLSGHSSQVNTVQMDDLKIVSGGDDGFVRVWDLRMAKKLWEIHNRHPVKHCHFTKNRLIVGNVPTNNMPVDEFESATHRRYRGSVQVYDFSVDQTTQGVPDICLSTYDEPEASHYNISLAMPYDKL